MVQKGQITFYSHPASVYSHRVEIALKEAKADYTDYEVDLANKPSWYAARVNPVGKIPAITYGGPNTEPDDPSPEAAKINESLIILEFLADIFPEAHLLPSDPVLRAQARMFIVATDSLLYDVFWAFFFHYSPGADQTLLNLLESVQERLYPTGFAIGEWSNADMAVAPFLFRFRAMLRHDLGSFPVGEGTRVYEILQGSKFARFMKYINDIEQWPSFKATWDEAALVRMLKNKYFPQRA